MAGTKESRGTTPSRISNGPTFRLVQLPISVYWQVHYSSPKQSSPSSNQRGYSRCECQPPFSLTRITLRQRGKPNFSDTRSASSSNSGFAIPSLGRRDLPDILPIDLYE